mgnify:CR=1 FL=1
MRMPHVSQHISLPYRKYYLILQYIWCVVHLCKQPFQMKETIEEYFLNTASPDDFPSQRDYIATYRSFKDFMNREIHPEVKTMTTRLDETIYLNDHSANHVLMVIEKISALLGTDGFSQLSNYEIFFLLIAVHIHDAGHIFNGRDGHEKNGGKFLTEISKYTLSNIELREIRKIAQAHSGKEDPIGSLELMPIISGKPIRSRLLAALLRMGDELADGRPRSSNYLLDHNLISESSKLFHAFSSCLDSFEPVMASHEISMTFCLNRTIALNSFRKNTKNGLQEIYLIDEIYTRSLKTFCECLYYNRFVPDNLRLSTLNVTINFIEEGEFDDFYERITYRIEEKGYPNLSFDNIFELCGDSLKRNGINLTGENIKNHLKNEVADNESV